MTEQLEADSPWKQALEAYFTQFMAFFFPEAHGQIDWQREWVFLDKELEQIVRDAELGRRFVDKLVQVWSLDGQENWLLLHLEIQGQWDKNFPKRMFTYHYRIGDRYDRPVASFAILTDENPNWQPNSYEYAYLGTSQRFQFSTIKLLDYLPQLLELEQNPNPFAVVVLAHLQALATRRAPQSRLQWKLRLVKGLYQRGFKRQDILELFRIIDWLLALPEGLEEQFKVELVAFEEERRMPYITSVERLGIKQGIEQGIQIGTDDALRNVALNMLREGADIAFIAKTTGLSIEQIQELQTENGLELGGNA
jgi:predicted transposase YdaD